MDVASLPEALIAGQESRSHDADPPIRCRGVERLMSLMARARAPSPRATIAARSPIFHVSDNAIGGSQRIKRVLNLKYLVIAAVVGLLFIFLYSRLRPYLRIIQKVLNVVSDVSVTNLSDASSPRRTNPKAEHKLLRCESCGTWIPSERALTLSSGLSTYCSQECLEKNAGPKERKLAG